MNSHNDSPLARTGTHSIQVGDTRVTAIVDTCVEAPPDLLAGLSNEQVAIAQDDRLRGTVPFITINCFLVETKNHRILVDSGVGGAETAATGRIESELRSLGIAPHDISHVLFTHLHADHYGGVISEAGASRFPRSEFIAHRAEYEFCFGGGEPAGNASVMEQYTLAQRLRPVLPQFRWVEQGPLMGGIELVHLPGHTPGHSGFRVRSGAESVFLWGDIVHQPKEQFAHPSVGVAFDVDPILAAETRRKTMEKAARIRDLIGGTHTDFPVFGHVEADGSGFKFIPRQYTNPKETRA